MTMPAASHFVMTVEESDATLRLRLTGEFDLAGVGPVENALDRLSRAPMLERVVFDLRGLTFLDIAGLHTILRAHARGLAEAFEVEVVRPRGLANRVFTLTAAGKQLGMVNEPRGSRHRSAAAASEIPSDAARRSSGAAR